MERLRGLLYYRHLSSTYLLTTYRLYLEVLRSTRSAYATLVVGANWITLMLEKDVERRLKRLEDWGFLVLKFRTPGYSGTMDRIILRPTYAPGPPIVVEVKRPGETERRLQECRRDEWRKRGVDVRNACSTIDEIDNLIVDLKIEVHIARANALAAEAVYRLLG